MSKSNNNRGVIGLATIVFLIFLTLKLAQIGEVATWSWWWVTSPIWISVGAMVILVIVFSILAIAILILKAVFRGR